VPQAEAPRADNKGETTIFNMSQVIALGPAARMLTTREAAMRLGVSLRTVQLWVEASILPAARTPGGHRRIPYSAVEALALSMGLPDEPMPSAVRGAADSLRHLPEAPVARPEAVNGVERRPCKIVVVSRDAQWARDCASALEVFGPSVEVHTADNGYVALLMIGRESVDLLVTTLELPGMDGREMLHTLERCEVLPRLSVLTLMPEGSVVGDEDAALPAGVEHLTLPVSPEALAIRVGRWLLTRQTWPHTPHD
jgi:excisionase family DNA binding protein